MREISESGKLDCHLQQTDKQDRPITGEPERSPTRAHGVVGYHIRLAYVAVCGGCWVQFPVRPSFLRKPRVGARVAEIPFELRFFVINPRFALSSLPHTVSTLLRSLCSRR